ncbi:hypothetical protein [Exiguobacterium sp. s192]|uniref:hypothetical protein n=1 Tax=Exiguobacterium sp. s192 TaxID=2751206 RepID=UPI001BEC7050
MADQLRKRHDGSIRKVINTRRMEDLFVVWLEEHVRLSKAETTYHSYHNIVKRIPLSFKNIQSKEVTPAHAQRLIVEWDKKGLKPSTINSHRAIMVGLFSWTKRMGFTDHLLNSFSLVVKLSEVVKDMTTLTASEYLKVALQRRPNATDDGHVCACHSHSTGKYGFQDRGFTGRQKSRSTERLLTFWQKN